MKYILLTSMLILVSWSLITIYKSVKSINVERIKATPKTIEELKNAN